MGIIRTRTLKAHSFLVVLIALATVTQFGCFNPPAGTAIAKREVLPSISSSSYNEEPDALPEVQLPSEKFQTMIQRSSDRYDVDWVLVLSVMRQESQFRPNARSRTGAFGLMQLMPVTSHEMKERLGVGEVRTPGNNIRAGVLYIRTLFDFFKDAPLEDRLRLSLAAYNAGLGRIMDARSLVCYLGGDPDNWQSVRAALPLLSRRYYTLHEKVWPSGRPSTYLNNWKQTANYVDKVMKHYEEYSLTLK